MLEFLRGRATGRKLRLFAVGCCRSIWPLLTDVRSRQLVGIAERLADGTATTEECDEARRRHSHCYEGGASAAEAAAHPGAWSAAWSIPFRLFNPAVRAARWSSRC